MKWQFAAFLGLVFAASCGGSKDGPTGRADPLTTSEGICAKWAAAACNDDVVRACNGSSGTTSECVADQEAFCLDILVGEDFDRKLAQDCIDTVEAAYKDSEITAEERQEVILASTGPCADVLASGSPSGGGEGGTGGDSPPAPKAAGATCDPEVDVCVNSAYCDVDVCRLKAAAGAFCCTTNPMFLAPVCGPDSEEVPCAPGTFCGEDGLCVSLGETDAACDTDDQCAADYYCSSESTCQPLGTDSDSCEADDECASGFFCSESFHECRDFIVVGNAELCRYLGA